MKKFAFLLALCIALIGMTACQSSVLIPADSGRFRNEIPVARRGTVLEVVSPSEVRVEAYGEYYGTGSNVRAQRNDVNTNGTDLALLDARRTAIYLLLFEGSDPLLSTNQERMLFQQHSTHIYHPETLRRYITYEDSQFTSRVFLEEGTALRVAKRFRVNKDRLLADLAERRITIARQTLMQTMGNPILMVIPDARTAQSPLDVLAADTVARQGSTVLQSYLTAKGYEVVVPEQTAEIAQIIGAQQMSASGTVDFAYQLALSIGSDIYLTFSGYAEVASFGTYRYVATVNAYETTSARLLGSYTRYR